MLPSLLSSLKYMRPAIFPIYNKIMISIPATKLATFIDWKPFLSRSKSLVIACNAKSNFC